MKKVISIMVGLLQSVTLLILVALLVARFLFGMTFPVILTGSMMPEFNPGDMIFCSKANHLEIKEGDVIAFYSEDKKAPVCHRIIKIKGEEDNLLFYTKGDNSQSPDENPTSTDNLIGKIYEGAKIPYIGYLMKYVGEGNGLIVMIVILISLCSVVFFSRTEEDNIVARGINSRLSLVKLSILGIAILSIVSWRLMDMSITEKEMKLYPLDGKYTIERRVDNKGIIPLTIVFVPKENAEVSETAILLMPGGNKQVKITSYSGTAIISSGAFFPLLPKETIEKIFAVNPRIVSAVIAAEMALVALPLMAIVAMMPDRKPQRGFRKIRKRERRGSDWMILKGR